VGDDVSIAALRASLPERAEDALAYMRRSASARERWTNEYVLYHLPIPTPMLGGATQLRLAESRVDEARADIQRWFADLGRNRFIWAVGAHSTPANLADLLLSAGARPVDDPEAAVMVLEEEPPSVEGVEIRPVRTREEFDAQREVRFEAFDFSEEVRAAARARGERGWLDFLETGGEIHVAYLDGELAATGAVTFTRNGLAFLLGGATAAAFRGRGAYRALVRSRWDEAVRRGIPQLVVHAGRMSRPILQQLGFRTISELVVLEDHIEAASSREPS